MESVAHEVPVSRPATKVISRERLHARSIVEYKLPRRARQGAYIENGREYDYFQFCSYIAGGRVNFFVHTSKAEMLGKSITASVSIFKKKLSDGREFLYVDLYPIANATPTHRITVVNAKVGAAAKDDALVFTTPAPLSGAILLTPVTASVSPKAEVSKQPEKKKSATGDFQLDRLIDAGWHIKSENGTEVTLTRMRDGRERTMVHHKPKRLVKSLA